MAEFVEQALANPPTPPNRPALPPRPPARPAGIWADMTPEERTAHAKKLAAMRQNKNMSRPYKRPRGPRGWAAEDAAVVKTNARLRAEELVERLIAEGQIDPDDSAGAKATVEALTRVASPGGCKRKRAQAARRLIAHYGPAIVDAV